MKKIIFSLLLLISISISAQNSGPILTTEQNSSWITQLKEQDLAKQLEMIRTRWEEDVKVNFKVSEDAHGIKNVHEEEKRKSYKYESRCRPLYLINKEEEGQISFPANPSSQRIAAVSKLLSPENISEVKVASKSTQLIYGQRGSCGVIYITVAESAIFDRIASELKE